jgi:hypothetical protein
VRRRNLLQAIGTGGTASLAGCGESSSESVNQEDGSNEQTEDSALPDDLSDEQAHERYLSDSLAEYRVFSWSRKEQIRVYDESEDDVAFVEAENGWFLEVTLTVYNAGGDTKTVPGRDKFSLYYDGEEHTRITELPSEEFDFEDVREGYYDVVINPRFWFVTSEVEPDRSAEINLLFDVESEPIEWAVNITGSLSSQPEQAQYVYYAE